MFQVGTSLKWLLPITGLAVTIFSILVYFDPHRIRRVTSFLDVEANADDSAYQLWQGMLAFGVGGVDGVGLGMGRQQMHFLPEAHTDFIFPVIGEELGLLCTFGFNWFSSWERSMRRPFRREDVFPPEYYEWLAEYNR